MNPWLVKNFIHPTQRFLRQDGVIDKVKELEHNQWLSRKELDALQWKKLARLLEHIYKDVPFYRDLFNELKLKPEDIQSPEDFSNIPLLTKSRIKDNIRNMITRDASLKGIGANTGGSTGETLFFYKGITGYGLANVIRLNRWCGKDIGDREVIFWGTPFDVDRKKKIVLKIKDYFQNVLHLSTFDMSEQTMSNYAETIRRFRPCLIRGYPSALYTFANYLKRNGIHDIRPRAVMSTGEKSFEFQKELMKDVFDCDVYERYGSNEFGNIAHECSEHHGLHILTDLFYVEILKNNMPVETGETGEIVVTSLDNYYMPFVRYKIGDMGAFTDAQCSCGRGFPMLEDIKGRSFDVILTPSGKTLGGFFWTFISRAVPGIKQFQVLQKDIGKIVFKIVPDESFVRESLKRLEQEIKNKGGTDIKVDFNIVDEIPLTPSGKFRFIVSDISKDRLVMKSKIHKAVVTDINDEMIDSITVDEELMKMVNLKEHEKVLIVDNANGARVETFVVKGEKGSGVISINGASAHHVKKGDEIIIMAFTWTNQVIAPQVVLVDENNKFVEFLVGGEF